MVEIVTAMMSPMSLCDVRRDRDYRPSQLRRETVGFIFGKLIRGTVNSDGEIDRPLPNEQVTIAPYSLRMGGAWHSLPMWFAARERTGRNHAVENHFLRTHHLPPITYHL